MTVWGRSRITEEKLVNLTKEYDKWKIGITKASVYFMNNLSLLRQSLA